MKKMTLIATAVFSLALAPLAPADDRPEHFKGKPAETLEEAVANFAEYNNRLDALLDKEELSPQDLHEVHQLTYTLENALEKINNEFGDLADTLEEIHLASERADARTVKNRGRDYLDTARQVID